MTVIAFDCEGTLQNFDGTENTKVTDLFVALSKFDNVELVVWTGHGEDHAKKVVDLLALNLRVTKKIRTACKSNIVEIKPDIVVDDKTWHGTFKEILV